MTVSLITTTHHYLGVAADVKPTTSVLVGSLFDELDTGLRYEFDGTSWIAIGPIAPGGFLSTQTKGSLTALWQSAGVAPTVLDLTFTHITHISGVALDYSAFTAGAILTVKVYKKVNGVQVLGPTLNVTVGSPPYSQYLPVENSGDDCDAVASAYKITLSSNTPADDNKSLGYQYVTRYLR